MNEKKPILWQKLQSNYTILKTFTISKVSFKLYNFRVSVYKGVPFSWMKWYPSFKDDNWPRILLWKVSLTENLVLNYTTLEFPFIKGLPSHEWNDTQPLMMTTSQGYECVNVSLSDKWVQKCTTLGFPFIKGFPSHERNKTHPLTMTAGQLYDSEKVSLSKKLVLIYTSLGLPFIRGFPPMIELKPFL